MKFITSLFLILFFTGIINAQTLSSVTTSPACINTQATVQLNGMVPNSINDINYTMAGTAQNPISVQVDSNGVASFQVLATVANLQVVITAIQRTDITETPFTPVSGNSVLLTVDTKCSIITTEGNTTLPNIESYIYSTIVANAQAYLWRVTTLSGNNIGQVQTKQTALRQFRISSLQTFAYDRQFKVEVAVMINDVWGPYSASCNVSTPSVVTQMIGCPITINTMNDYVYCNIVRYAKGYRFRVTSLTDPLYIRTVDYTLRNLKMGSLDGILYDTTYNVEVAVINTDGTLLPYNPVSCTVTTPPFPTTQIVASQCGQTFSNSTNIYADIFNDVSAYRFLLTNTALGYSQTKDNVYRVFTFNNFTGVTIGTTYDVKVALQIGGIWGPYGSECTVTLGIAPTFSAVAPICSGTTLNALPTTSTNGITGTWSPALNNTLTTTYTFTPTVGQYAATKTLTITVNPKVMPTFTAVSPICSGASLLDLPTTSTNGVTGTWSPALDNTTTKTYTFTPTAGLCASITTMEIVVYPKEAPTFTAVAPICSGASLLDLPTTSNNAITGTWLPAALNNTATTTYTFTPNSGQCATTTTMEIVVNSNLTPIFNPIAPFCSGSTLSPLPTTSINGVTGTWSPTLNSNLTQTYTFTPDLGQCADTTSMTIIVDYIEPTFDDIAIIENGTINNELPEVSTNGIYGEWDNYIIQEGEHTYTFTPNQGQCAQTTTMTLMLLLPKKLEANDDEFAFAIDSPQPVVDITTESVLSNDWGWDTFGGVTLTVVNMSKNANSDPYNPLIVLNQNGTISINHRFWWLYDSNSITYKITQNSCPSNFATAIANIYSYNPNSSTARKAQTKTTDITTVLSDIISLYPNPSSGIFNLDLTSTNENFETIKVYNVLGATVYESRLNTKSLNQIDLSNVAKGYYIARLFNSENSKTIKLIKN